MMQNFYITKVVNINVILGSSAMWEDTGLQYLFEQNCWTPSMVSPPFWRRM